jgi:hypothetical protein
LTCRLSVCTQISPLSVVNVAPRPATRTPDDDRRRPALLVAGGCCRGCRRRRGCRLLRVSRVSRASRLSPVSLVSRVSLLPAAWGAALGRSRRAARRHSRSSCMPRRFAPPPAVGRTSPQRRGTARPPSRGRRGLLLPRRLCHDRSALAMPCACAAPHELEAQDVIDVVRNSGLVYRYRSRGSAV